LGTSVSAYPTTCVNACVGGRKRQVQGLRLLNSRGMNQKDGDTNDIEQGRSTNWRQRAKHLDHRPEYVGGVPELLWELGEVFFPIPSGKKGYNYPHHLDEYRHSGDSEILNAYLEQGWGYGIACANDLAVVDIDKKEFAPDIASKLPETLYQISGSREGYHLFYQVEGLDSRIIIHHKTEEHDCGNEDHTCAIGESGECEKEYEWDHLGEVKCDNHGYVVGPGSTHPSGKKYELVNDREIATITKEELRGALSEYIKPEINAHHEYEGGEYTGEATHEFYEITARDVMPGLTPGKRIAHPVHGSTTGSNFIMNDGGETFTCWRCQYGSGDGCGLGGVHLLASMETGHDCSFVRSHWRTDSTLHYHSWKKAVEKNLIKPEAIPHKVVKGFLIENTSMIEKDKVTPEQYMQARQEMAWCYSDNFPHSPDE